MHVADVLNLSCAISWTLNISLLSTKCWIPLVHVGCSRENFMDILGDDEDFLTAMNDHVDGYKSDEVG